MLKFRSSAGRRARPSACRSAEDARREGRRDKIKRGVLAFVILAGIMAPSPIRLALEHHMFGGGEVVLTETVAP